MPHSEKAKERSDTTYLQIIVRSCRAPWHVLLTCFGMALLGAVVFSSRREELDPELNTFNPAYTKFVLIAGAVAAVAMLIGMFLVTFHWIKGDSDKQAEGVPEQEQQP